MRVKQSHLKQRAQLTECATFTDPHLCSCVHTWSRWPRGRCEQLAALSADCWTDLQTAAAGDPRAPRRGGQSGSWTTDPGEWYVTTRPWTSPAPARAAVGLAKTHWQSAHAHTHTQSIILSYSDSTFTCLTPRGQHHLQPFTKVLSLVLFSVIKLDFCWPQPLHPLTSSSSGDEVSSTFCLRRFLQKDGWSIRV